MKIKVESHGSDGNIADIKIDTSSWLVDQEEMRIIKQVAIEQLENAFIQIFDSENISVTIDG